MRKIGFIALSIALLGGLSETAAAQEYPQLTPALAAKPLTLVNGWVGGAFGAALPAVTKVGGIVYFKGAMSSGTTNLAFTLPPAYRPKHPVWVTADLCNASVGRLEISTNGSVLVVAQTDFADAQCFTSLDGIFFIP